MRRCTADPAAQPRDARPAPRCSTAPALILEIFGERAATREGVLQVELAHLNYQKSRLVRSWTHLERQRAAASASSAAPAKRRSKATAGCSRTASSCSRSGSTRSRRPAASSSGQRDDVPFPIVALVGYTNAGKSSLFNALTGAGVFAEDLLFATLDTTVRKIELPHGREVMLSDTVGFVADLPTDLVAAFRATLEEVARGRRDPARPRRRQSGPSGAGAGCAEGAGRARRFGREDADHRGLEQDRPAAAR